MAIDYIVQYPCAVRQQVTDQDLLDMLKARNRAETTIAAARQGNPQLSPEEIASTWQMRILVATPQGMTEQSVPVAQVLAQAEPLAHLSGPCKACPANLNKPAFGCIGVINYPVPRAVEEWLVARLPDDIKAPSLALLLRFLHDFKIDGAPVDSQRNRREVYELPRPVVRKWSGWLSSKSISSSQILHMLFFMGTLQPEPSILIAQLLGFEREPRNTAQPFDAASHAVAQMRGFMRTVLLAGQSKSPLLIDA